MSNDPRADLIYSILTLDSYSRGYGAGITNLEVSTDEKTFRLGKWIIDKNDATRVFRQDAFNAGFYALAYRDASTNETVISYRGTDRQTPSLGTLTGGSDVLNGYGLAFGLPGTGSVEVTGGVWTITARQAVLAEQFYGAVSNSNTIGTIRFVGHSLGGGLAGYVATVAGLNSVVFNHMPFTRGADARLQAITGNPSARANMATASAISTTGEVNAGIRAGNTQAWVGSWGGGYLLTINGYNIDGAALGAATDIAERRVPHVTPELNAHSSALSEASLHSMALLVALQWARAENKTEWEAAGTELWSAFFDPIVSDAIDIARAGTPHSRTVRDVGTSNATLISAVAYSALPIGEGELPFGDTGVWSMFDDAGELGRVLAGEEPAFFGENVVRRKVPGMIYDTTKDVTVRQLLADMLVQYAGALALYDIEQEAGEGSTVAAGDTRVDAREGILGYAAGVLSLDLSSVLWTDVFQAEKEVGGRTVLVANPVDPIDAAAFRKVFFEKAAGPELTRALKSIGISSPDELAKRFYGARDGHVIDRFGMVANNQLGGTYTLQARSYVTTALRGDNTHVDVFVATAGNDTITGTVGNDILVGEGGTDRIDAGSGNDIIVAEGGTGSITIGGMGRDIVINRARGGVIWGDVENSLSIGNGVRTYFASERGEDGRERRVRRTIADDGTNSDLFWFSADTTIMDAQHGAAPIEAANDDDIAPGAAA